MLTVIRLRPTGMNLAGIVPEIDSPISTVDDSRDVIGIVPDRVWSELLKSVPEPARTRLSSELSCTMLGGNIPLMRLEIKVIDLR